MDKHSPTPWRVIKAHDDEPARIIDANDDEVAVELIDADAALIVEAVNNYEGLIQERRRLIGELDAAKVHADSEKRWANEYFEAASAATAAYNNLRDLVRRLCDELESHYHEPESMNDPCIVREAREALGEAAERQGGGKQ